MRKIICTRKYLVTAGVVLIIVVFSSCGTKTGNNKTAIQSGETELIDSLCASGSDETTGIIEWKYDITHDGIDDTIKVSVDKIEDIYKYEGDDKSFAVYSGKTGDEIWSSESLCTVHMEQDGLLFSLQPESKQQSDIPLLNAFTEKVNGYLSKSFVLADTCNMGYGRIEPFIYSTPNNKVCLTYDDTNEVNEILDIPVSANEMDS